MFLQGGRRIMSKSIAPAFKRIRSMRAHGQATDARRAVATATLEKRRTHLSGLYHEADGKLKSKKAALAAAPNASIGIVHDWDCKAVWIDIKLDVPYGDKAAGTVHRFHNPLEIVLH